ncbi:insertion element IS1 protein InsB [Gammaproteobacteria bacterium]
MYRCNACGRHFVLNPEKYPISDEKKSYTDFWSAYAAIFPPKRHCAVGKESGQTNHIEKFNYTRRQRISRLVRKSLSFSKKLANHIGAIWYFIHHYNASLPINQNG